MFDRGYIDFESFDQMKWDGYFFVSRIKKNTVVHVVEDLDVPMDTDSDILSDQYVLLGGNGYLTSLIRLVTICRKGRSDLRIITNDVFKPAEEIGNLYHSRWQIELFFKHIKQHMTIKTYYSKAEVGVENQLIMALIVYLLTFLIKLELNLKPTIFQILRHLRSVKFESYDYFIALFEPG